VNGQIIEIKGADVRVAYHPSDGEPRIGEPLRLTPRGAGMPMIAQVIGYDSAGYPGDREVALGELLEARIAEKHEVVMGEPALVDLKEIKVARCKIRKIIVGGDWKPWNGTIPTRNVDIEPVEPDELVTQVVNTSTRAP
jgi:hypothetical protein